VLRALWALPCFVNPRPCLQRLLHIKPEADKCLLVAPQRMDEQFSSRPHQVTPSTLCDGLAAMRKQAECRQALQTVLEHVEQYGKFCSTSASEDGMS
jgi:hypothetical protein